MKLKDSFLASHSQREKSSGWLESRKRLPVFKSNPASKMIQVLLVIICLAVFPYQGSSIILESGNVNDYEIVYPKKVTVLPTGAMNSANPCCDPVTCKPRRGEHCVSGPCCRNCKFLNAGTICKYARGDDMNDYCTGISSDCPRNPYKD